MRRLLAALVVAGLLVAALPVASVAAAGKGGGVTKATLCHVAADGSQHTITVGAPAVKAHVGRHAGDHRGACTTAPVQTQCVFTATDSTYTVQGVPPANGPITFTWRLSDGLVTTGLWHEIYPANSGQATDYALSGTVIGENVNLTIVASSVPLVGTLHAGVLTAHTVTPSGNWPFSATGTRTCS